MDKKEKEQIRRKLLDKKETIVSKLSRTVAESKEVDTDIAQDVADKAESSYTKEFLLSLSDTERDLLLHIDDALRSLEKGCYGVCLTCGQAISKKRLDALPWSTHCLDCQQKIEMGAEIESEA
jgi:DnaK suppressor protein